MVIRRVIDNTNIRIPIGAIIRKPWCSTFDIEYITVSQVGSDQRPRIGRVENELPSMKNMAW